MLKVIQKLKVGSAIGLGTVGLATISSLNFAHAETSTSLNLTANVAEAGLSVTLPGGSNANINLAPPFSGTATNDASVTVQVGAHSGYQLFMVTDNTNLVSSGDSTKVIPTLDSDNCNSTTTCGISENSFTTNAWGFNVGSRNSTNTNTNYMGFPKDLSYYKIGNYNEATTNEGDSYVVKFGAKVDYNQDPGVYTGTINFVAIADNSRVYMQYMNAGDCTTTAQTVYDSRDNKSYIVKQLADGKCWMLDNLALDPTADNGNGGTIMDNMTALNTNASAQSLAILKGGANAAGVDNTSKKYASAGITTTWKENFITGVWANNKTTWTDHRLDSDWETKKDNYTDNWTVPRVNISNISKVQTQDWNDNNGGDYKIGVYYNYCSASAGTYCYDGPVYSAADSSQNQASTMTGSPADDTKATEDICPAGWSMPTGSNSGEFRALYQAYGGSATGSENNVAFKTALSTPLSGSVSYSSGAVVSVGADGNWWSSTRGNTNFMYNLLMGASNVYPAFNSLRSLGFSIRCVLN